MLPSRARTEMPSFGTPRLRSQSIACSASRRVSKTAETRFIVEASPARGEAAARTGQAAPAILVVPAVGRRLNGSPGADFQLVDDHGALVGPRQVLGPLPIR